MYWSDRILVFDGPDDQSMPIGELSGTHNHKVLTSISSSGKSIYVVFKKQHSHGSAEFEASIKYTKINHKCQSWLKNSTLISPNHPNINCSWIITVKYGSFIILDFKFVEVKPMNINVKYKNISIIITIIESSLRVDLIT